jgi:paxillin
MALDNSDNHKDQQLGQHIHFSPPKPPHSPKKPSPLRQCQRLSSIPDYDKVNNLSLHNDDSATYLQDLRNNRVARLNGSRPPPPSRIASKRQQQRPTSPDDAIPTKTNVSAPITNHARQRSLDSVNFAGRPLVAQPGPYNLPKSVSLVSLPLHEAIEELNLDEEQRIHAAAQDEAAELVWKHRTGHDPEKERASAYTNPDVDSKAARKDYRAHLRTTSKDKIESRPLSTSRPEISDSPISSPERPSTRVLPDDPFVEPTHVSTPTSTPRSTRSKGKSYEGLANAVANDVAVSKRRVSSGSKRRPSADVKAGFMSPTDKIYEEPDEQPKEARTVEVQKATTKVESKSEGVPRHVRRNPFARVRQAQERFEKKESPSGYSIKKNDEKESVSGYTANKHERIEIQRNPPSQSRNAFYTVNDSAPASPNLPPQVVPEKVVEDSPKIKDGKEIRGDDIRSATAMRRKDRSPNLPQPTAVSDSPGRPIVSFQSGWKPKEIQLVEEKSVAFPECLALGKNPPSDAALSGKQRRYSLPHSQQGPPPLPTIVTPDEPASRSAKGSMPTISVMSADIPMIVVPDDPISSPSKTLSEEPDIPRISLSSDSVKPPVFVINEPSNVKAERPPLLQHRPQSSPPKTSSPFSRRPLPTPTPSPVRPLPVPSKTSPYPAVAKPHMTPSVRRNTALCAHCALPIAGRILSAAGERFHPSCFKCHECSINLECVAFYPEPDKKRAERLARIQQRRQGLDVYLPDGVTEEDMWRLEEQDGDESLRFFCGLDFHEFFSPRCKSCKTPIEGEVVVACGAEWHVGHFFCAQCGDVSSCKILRPLACC